MLWLQVWLSRSQNLTDLVKVLSDKMFRILGATVFQVWGAHWKTQVTKSCFSERNGTVSSAGVLREYNSNDRNYVFFFFSKTLSDCLLTSFSRFSEVYSRYFLQTSSNFLPHKSKPWLTCLQFSLCLPLSNIRSKKCDSMPRAVSVSKTGPV